MRRIWVLTRSIALSAFWGFFDNRLSTAAAAMAFYTMFALGPILILSIAIAEPFVGRMMIEQTVLSAMSTIISADNLEIVRKFAREDLFAAAASPPSTASSCCSTRRRASSSSSMPASTRSGTAAARTRCTRS
jgi:hypothetical protein